LIVLDQETDAHQLHSVIHGGNQGLAIAHSRTLPEPHHQRDGRAVNVAIEQSYPRAQALQRAGEIHRDGALAHAPLSARNGDHAFDTRDATLLRPGIGAGRPCIRSGRLLDLDTDLVDTRQGAQRLLAIGPDLRRQLRAVGWQREINADRAGVGRHFLDQAKRHNVAGIAGVFHRLEGGHDFVTVGHEFY